MKMKIKNRLSQYDNIIFCFKFDVKTRTNKFIFLLKWDGSQWVYIKGNKTFADDILNSPIGYGGVLYTKESRDFYIPLIKRQSSIFHYYSESDE